MNRPNVIWILGDDMGYGDVSCFNPEGKIPTPNIDRIAGEGLAFHDAHSTSAVCTPSRYSILTGRYCWRRLPKGVLQPYADALIPESRMTVADLFARHGYHTACVGKWHLGMSWQQNEDGSIDLTKPVKEGPMVNGFQEYFGVDVPNFPPFSYLEGNRLNRQPTTVMHQDPENHMRGISRDGPAVEGWDLEQILPDITTRACRVIRENAEKEQPFFLYFPLTSPHTPLAVHDDFKGKSGLDSDYADFVIETDAMVGRVLDQIDASGITDNTWVIFTTDNGCAGYIGARHLEEQGHYPSYHWRGYKSQGWDGGHKIPLVMRWPQVIKPGRVYEKYVSLGDFMATAADMLGEKLPDNAGEDSISYLSVLQGTGDSAREVIIHHSHYGKFAVRKGRWKLILCAGSGGFDQGDADKNPMDAAAKEMGLPPYQLYDMVEDPGEQNNLYPQMKQKAQELLEILEDYIRRGRSTPGADQKNDLEVVIDPEIDGTPLLEE